MNNETYLMNASGQGRLRDSPGVIIFPPALSLGTFLLGLMLRFLWMWPIFPESALTLGLRIVGAVVIGLAIALMIWGRNTMVRAGTNVDPGKPVLAMVTGGPFRFTRNPLYLGNVLVYLGLTMMLNSAWLLVLFTPMVLVFRWGIIQREERYLESKFGGLYLDYKARVRRWL